jgi:hypothetical protein
MMPEPAASQTETPTGLITRLTARFPERLVWTGFVFVNGFVAIAILATIAMLSKAPFIFPSLGASAILMFYALSTAGYGSGGDRFDAAGDNREQNGRCGLRNLGSAHAAAAFMMAGALISVHVLLATKGA